MFLGSLFFFCGFIGLLAIVCISVFNPWNYNGIGGFAGFLLGSDTLLFFLLFCILSVIGAVICSLEAFKRSEN
jgi:hypothetical protein